MLAQTAAVWFMTGSVWTMQVLNYPLLAQIGPTNFKAYESAHNRRFIAIVGPGVAVTLLTTIALFVARPAAIPLTAPIAEALLLLVIVVSTVCYAAPAHAALARDGFDLAVHAKLLRGNWVRTFAWTLLGLIDLWMLHQLRLG